MVVDKLSAGVGISADAAAPTELHTSVIFSLSRFNYPVIIFIRATLVQLLTPTLGRDLRIHLWKLKPL